jgi:hypothetical protein
MLVHVFLRWIYFVVAFFFFCLAYTFFVYSTVVGVVVVEDWSIYPATVCSLDWTVPLLQTNLVSVVSKSGISQNNVRRQDTTDVFKLHLVRIYMNLVTKAYKYDVTFKLTKIGRECWFSLWPNLFYFVLKNTEHVRTMSSPPRPPQTYTNWERTIDTQCV